jgi:hypothetical protein
VLGYEDGEEKKNDIKKETLEVSKNYRIEEDVEVWMKM